MSVSAPAAGELRTRVILQRVRRAINAHSETEEHWEPITTLWVGFRRQAGSEQFIAEAAESHERAVVVSRYYSDLTPEDRLVAGDGSVWEIESVVDPEHRHMRLEMAVRRLA